jgi:hypothetical protein
MAEKGGARCQIAELEAAMLGAAIAGAIGDADVAQLVIG